MAAWLLLAAAATLDRACEWLEATQRPDGGWAAPAVLPGDGSSPSVTALCAWALAEGAPESPAVARAVEFLRGQVDRDGAAGTLVEPWDFPNYASAAALEVFTRVEGAGDLADRVRAYLERSRLDEDYGFAPVESQYGGWDFGRPHGRMWFREDLSVTAFVMSALAQAGHGDWEGSRAFLDRCRNEHDGGYVFSPWMSKAGYDEIEGEWVGRSYGSMTADGLRSLWAAGVPREDPRVEGAMAWLRERYASDHNPGFERVQSAYAESTQFYWLFVSADAFAKWGEGPEGWAEATALRLAALQREDGSFANGNAEMREQEPALATAFAVLALRRAVR